MNRHTCAEPILRPQDVQGWELRVLLGAQRLLRTLSVKYVVFEFSPWLMRRSGTGHPLDLLYLLPSMGGVCFDLMGLYNQKPRPSTPLRAYYEHLDVGNKSNLNRRYASAHGGQNFARLPWGPFEDIMCWFPQKRGIDESDSFSSINVSRFPAAWPADSRRGYAREKPPQTPPPVSTTRLSCDAIGQLTNDWHCEKRLARASFPHCTQL